MNRAATLTAAVLLAACGSSSVQDSGPVETCATAGGSCTAVSACGKGAGYLGPNRDCTGESVCCVPLAACNNAVEFECCSNVASYRPTCEGGALKCATGTSVCGSDAGSGVACVRSAGGSCTAVSACGVGGGYLANFNDCPGAGSQVCCLPLTACGNAKEFECCEGAARFRPSCATGQLYCPTGDTCPVVVVDAGRDAGTDAGTDAGVPDAGVSDAGVPDAGVSDAGVPDAGSPDAGSPDAAIADAGAVDAGDAG
jgi:hypothetical protein